MSDVHPGSNTEAIFAEKRSDAFSTDVFEKSDQGWSGEDFNPEITISIGSVMFFLRLAGFDVSNRGQGLQS